MEYELAEIYKRLCNGETDLQIMNALCLQERNYYKYKKRLETRLMEYQLKKTNNTIFIESQLFKNRMLTLYRILENQVISDKTTGIEKAKCAEIAANIAIDVLKMESEGIKKVIKDALTAEREAARRSSLSAITSDSNSSDMMMDDDDLEES